MRRWPRPLQLPGEGESEVRMNSGELSAALAQAAGVLPATTAAPANSSTSASSSPSPAGPATEFPGAVPNIKDYQIFMDGDIVRGQFLTQIAGKDVYLTLAGHLGAKDGYATFDATEVKVGDLGEKLTANDVPTQRSTGDLVGIAPGEIA